MSKEGFEKLQHISRSLEGHAHVEGYVLAENILEKALCSDF